MAVQKSDHFNKQQPFFAHFSQEPPASVPEWRLPSFNMMLDRSVQVTRRQGGINMATLQVHQTWLAGKFPEQTVEVQSIFHGIL
jgi:hypothetical protein